MNTSLARRAALALAAVALFSFNAGAQPAWPGKTIKLVVPFSPGGSNDTFARVLAGKLTSRLGQPVVVDNRPGSGGTIGTEYVAKAAPDGYTLLLASASITSNAAFGKKLGYDPVKDLTPIGRIVASPFAIVVANSVKVKSLKELIAMARAKPDSINYGSAGVGGMNHLGTELFASAAKVDFVHVPYKGISLAFTDLIGGSLQLLVPSLASALPQIQAGKMHALAVTSAQRSPLAPDIPTAAEAGLPGFELDVWYGLLGPAGLPAPVVKRLNEELNAILVLPDVKEVFAKEAATPLPGKPEDLAKLIQSELTRWTRLIKEKNIQMD